MATLAVYRGDQLLRKVELGEGPMRIGRAPENEIVLEDANKGVSRTHAEIRHEEGRYIILDLNSQNGVWIGSAASRSNRCRSTNRSQSGRIDWSCSCRHRRRSSSTSIPGTVISALPCAEPDSRAHRTRRPAAGTPHVGARNREPVRSQRRPSRPLRRHAPPPSRRKDGTRDSIIAGVAVAAIAAIAVFAMMNRGPPEARRRDDGPAPEVAQATTTVPPAPAPTDEERFQDHFDKAQGLIEGGRQGSAPQPKTRRRWPSCRTTSAASKQRADIDAIGAPPAPPPANVNPAAATPAATVAAAAAAAQKKNRRDAFVAHGRRGRTNRPASAPRREKNARYHLDDGKKALEERRYAERDRSAAARARDERSAGLRQRAGRGRQRC